MKYRNLGHTGLRVSRICLGTMTFGMKDWGCDQDAATAITQRFVERGGNFIDTADMYSRGVSETMLGKAVADMNRDDLVLATKCYFPFRDTANARGLSRKHIVESVNGSLKRLGTDHIDLYQIHGPDPYTPVEETMRALDDLIRQGKVLYIGCSNLYAWQIVKHNAIAQQFGGERFCSAQHLYNLIVRDVEREILGACADQGMSLICWSPLASGMLSGKYKRADKPVEGSRIAHRASMDMPRYWHDSGFRIVDEVVAVAKETGRTPAQVSLAWLLHEARVAAVIIGARTVEQVDDNCVVGDFDLDGQTHQRLADVVPFDHGYPLQWINITYPPTFGGVEHPPPRPIGPARIEP
jgi:aryl-alcohol dehydrogenase-like predicted oxidoreductase